MTVAEYLERKADECAATAQEAQEDYYGAHESFAWNDCADTMRKAAKAIREGTDIEDS